MSDKHNLCAVAKQFRIIGDFVSGVPYGSGHINDTYAVTFNQSGTEVRYIFQRVNHIIFKDVPGLMDNISRVCDHAQRKLADAGVPDASRRSLTLISSIDGKPYCIDSEGLYWRAYLFVEDATGYDIIETEDQAYEAAYAFGKFQELLVDLPGKRLNETIPDFHNTPKRLERFEEALSADVHGRAAHCLDEINWLIENRQLAGALLEMNAQGLIPERVTHNDTKLNNVLIDNQTNKAVCVIDLDTLMPGLALYDFGDLVRTSTSPVAEDEKDPSKVTMQLHMFEALVKGYLAGAGDFLTETETICLPLSGMVITFECGMRFLTDYLQGDVYFKTKHPGHNLERCRTQFALVDSMKKQRKDMETCVQKILSITSNEEVACS